MRLTQVRAVCLRSSPSELLGSFGPVVRYRSNRSSPRAHHTGKIMESVQGRRTCAHAFRRRVGVRRGGATAALLMAGVLVSAAGCASGASGPSGPALGSSGAPSASGSAPAPGAASASASASVDQSSPQSQAAIATYRAMWADVVTVQATMNDRDLTLTDHLTGGALTYFHQAIYLNKQKGYVAKG